MTSLHLPLLFVALLTGMWITERGSDHPRAARLFYLLAVMTGAAGGRLWVWLQYGSEATGMSAWGFLLSAAIGVGALLFAWRWMGGRWIGRDFPDAVTPSIAFTAGLARLGCFLEGCCYGQVTDLPWAVRYGPDSPAFQGHLNEGWINSLSPSSLPIHPTQLYEAGAAFLVFGALLLLPRRLRSKLLPHELFGATVMGYGVWRFLIGFVRGDAGPLLFGSLSVGQVTSLFVLLALTSILAGRRVFRSRTPHLHRTAV